MKHNYDKADNTSLLELKNLEKIDEMKNQIKSLKEGRKSKSTPFMIKELEGRIKALEAYPKSDIRFTEGQYTSFDAYVMTDYNFLKTIVEIKDRNITSTTYKEAQFEEGKLSKMMSIANDRGIPNVIFMAHYTDGVTAVWDLKKYVSTPSVPFLSPYQTVGNNTKVVKKMKLLPLSEATIIKRVNK